MDQGSNSGEHHMVGSVGQPVPVVLLERVQSAFRDVYLTLTSIIQGVAFGFLAERVFSDPSPTLNQWICYTICVLVIIAAWQEYMVGATAFTWIPTLLDSIIPFGFGVVEFTLIAAVRRGTGSFLVCLGILVLAGLVAYGNWWFHAANGSEFNRQSYPTLGRYARFGTIACAALLLATLALAWAYLAGSGVSDTVFLTVALALVLPLFLHSIVNWSLPLYRIQRSGRIAGSS